MSNEYLARYAHSDADTPGELRLKARTDEEAVAEVVAFVEGGYRNGTWCNVELSDGTTYGAANRYGKAVAGAA